MVCIFIFLFKLCSLQYFIAYADFLRNASWSTFERCWAQLKSLFFYSARPILKLFTLFSSLPVWRITCVDLFTSFVKLEFFKNGEIESCRSYFTWIFLWMKSYFRLMIFFKKSFAEFLFQPHWAVVAKLAVSYIYFLLCYSQLLHRNILKHLQKQIAFADVLVASVLRVRKTSAGTLQRKKRRFTNWLKGLHSFPLVAHIFAQIMFSDAFYWRLSVPVLADESNRLHRFSLAVRRGVICVVWSAVEVSKLLVWMAPSRRSNDCDKAKIW